MDKKSENQDEKLIQNNDSFQELPAQRKQIFITISIVFGLLVVTGQYFYLYYLKEKPTIQSSCPIIIQSICEPLNEKSVAGPKYWFHDVEPSFERFEEIGVVLNRLGWQRISMNYTTNVTDYVNMDWDMVWSYMSIDAMPIDKTQLKYYQRVNHFPGTVVLLAKDFLTTMKPSPHIPRGFNSYTALQEYARQHPNARFLQKNRDNRGISLKKVSEIEIVYEKGLGTFAQVYAEDPFLIDGHKFDMSSYVLITSVNPLRVYFYARDSIFRICPLPYDANDTENMDRHIITPTQLLAFDFPALKKYMDHNYLPKSAFELYFAKHGVDSNKIYEQAENIVREIILEREHFLVKAVEKYPSKFSFFELIRVDMMLDKNLKLHVIEMNQHPNLHAFPKFKKFRATYENVIFNMFNVVGAGSTWKKKEMRFSSYQEELMVMGTAGILVKPELCVNYPCNETCPTECNLCKNCMTSTQSYDLIQAYQEAMHVGAFKRIFPVPNVSVSVSFI